MIKEEKKGKMVHGWNSQSHPGPVGPNVGYSQHINPQESYVAGSVYKSADGSASFNGGPLSRTNNPIAAFLGTAPRDIKTDPDLSREDYIRDMYEAYDRSSSARMSNVMITKITNMMAYPITEICPWKLATGIEFQTETMIFDDEYL